ncbi:uracil phosphoribosyltransferase [Streptomyces somaliensis DSM 40738]|uniref:uracil phosphoribosyltransferase n=1 Tax=Streptomyces somaliensis (strain ATCC 33201 / DSM 40738 / JCM 12659 / KCTC 9044 / NCTC 11332 / NRRL B-12077 / IP 733) TaxID=1134445 RepID=A0AA44DEJ6_STRE0|nr:uracil phosphoribosyltransferase [Streptomyces somaliensis]MCQ0025024.1 uracil phosphoribosyltransferase [Streptomyces somaliensis DSM 40738]NKY15433.1 uracil phosphoribosyltransferase [Streptomyces somaliensis DSM 40738]
MTTGHNVHALPQTDSLRAMHTVIRDRDCPREDFVFHSRRIIRLLLEAATDLLPFTEKEVTTPVGATYRGLEPAAAPCAVSVIRAGDAVEGELRDILPGVRIGKVLIQRDKRTKQPRLYYRHLPADIADRYVLLLEPMLATAGSALAAIDVLLEAGVGEGRIIMVNLLSSPEGLRRVRTERPSLRIVTSAVEDRLNEHAFMVPGIGDFGDRFFGTTDCGIQK